MNGAHLHLLLNHLPVVGSLIGLVVLLVGLWRKSADVQRTGLGILVGVALVAIPTFLTGEPAEHVVEGLPGVAEGWIEAHEEAATLALVGALIVGLLALVTVFLGRKKDALGKGLLQAVALLALILLGLFARVAWLGGGVRHTEIHGNAAIAAEAEHDEDGD